MNNKIKKLLQERRSYCENNDVYLDIDEYMYISERKKHASLHDRVTKNAIKTGKAVGKALKPKNSYTELNDNKYKKWLAGGLGSLIGVISGGSVGKRGTITSRSGQVLGLVGGYAIGTFLADLYKTKTDKCKNHCGKDKLCYYGCYVKASDEAISKVRKDMSALKSISDTDKRDAVHRKLLRQLVFYEKKRTHFIEELKKLQKNRKERYNTPDVDIKRTRTRD